MQQQYTGTQYAKHTYNGKNKQYKHYLQHSSLHSLSIGPVCAAADAAHLCSVAKTEASSAAVPRLQAHCLYKRI